MWVIENKRHGELTKSCGTGASQDQSIQVSNSFNLSGSVTGG
jgi:hypothetical protein